MYPLHLTLKLMNQRWHLLAREGWRRWLQRVWGRAPAALASSGVLGAGGGPRRRLGVSPGDWRSGWRFRGRDKRGRASPAGGGVRARAPGRRGHGGQRGRRPPRRRVEVRSRPSAIFGDFSCIDEEKHRGKYVILQVS